MSELDALIRAEIHSLGSIRFDRFMELALYHPLYGYYRREWGKPRTGREGDFFTSVSVGPLFGRLLASQFREMWERLDKPPFFWIVEQGGEDAQLACDILLWCRDTAPDLFASLRYGLIEDAATLIAHQRENLEAARVAEKVTWFETPVTITEQNPMGVFFSNELIDAFPVRRIVRRKNSWMELQVGLGMDDSFAWVEKQLDEELIEAVNGLPLPTLEGYTTEINLRVKQWMKEATGIFQRGYFLTIDYGFPASVYYAPFRIAGTLTAYQKHQRMEDVLGNPGSRDLTAHIDFTTLAQAGENAGWKTLGFIDQQHFLMGIAHDELNETPDPSAGIRENTRAWQTLIHPGHLGTRFQVLLQAKDAPGDLAGLRYSKAVEL